MENLKTRLDYLYKKYNKREYISPDPLMFLKGYSRKRDREVAGFLAASFAYGRVEMIIKTVAVILGKMSPSPYQYIIKSTRESIADNFKGFKYRFATQVHLSNLILGMQDVIKKYASLENCFYEGWSPSDETIVPGLVFLTDQIRGARQIGHLLADPNKKSACKRSHLFLRWMVRQDQVDPGEWSKINPCQLIVPLDTHMFNVGSFLGFTKRKSMDLKTAIDITRGFKAIEKKDPVKYDFCLTRFGIQRGLSMEDLKDFLCNQDVSDQVWRGNYGI